MVLHSSPVYLHPSRGQFHREPWKGGGRAPKGTNRVSGRQTKFQRCKIYKMSIFLTEVARNHQTADVSISMNRPSRWPMIYRYFRSERLRLLPARLDGNRCTFRGLKQTEVQGRLLPASGLPFYSRERLANIAQFTSSHLLFLGPDKAKRTAKSYSCIVKRCEEVNSWVLAEHSGFVSSFHQPFCVENGSKTIRALAPWAKV